MTAQEPCAAVVVAWADGGHRLAYVAAIVRAAKTQGQYVELVTSRGVRDGETFAVHLGSDVVEGHLVVRIDGRVASHRGRLRVICALRKSAVRVIVPDGDTLIWPLALAAIVHRAPAHTSLVIMRPPDAHGRVRRQLMRLGKAGGLVLTGRLIRSIDLMLLEDPLAADPDRTWQGAIGSSGIALYDPGDFFLSEAPGTLPAEVDLAADRPVVSILGGVSARKRLGAVLDAFEQTDCGRHATLVVAGPLYSEVEGLLSHPAIERCDVRFVDRYLSNAEMAAVMIRSSAVFVLYGEKVSSGITMAAAMSGTWVVSADGSRTARTAAAYGFGIPCTLDPAGLATAIVQAVTKSWPSPVALPTSADFGRQLLTGSLASSFRAAPDDVDDGATGQ